MKGVRFGELVLKKEKKGKGKVGNGGGEESRL